MSFQKNNKTLKKKAKEGKKIKTKVEWVGSHYKTHGKRKYYKEVLINKTEVLLH